VDYPTLQNGYTVSGSITTNGSTGTKLPVSDITTYQLTVSHDGLTVFTLNTSNSTF
jgi:hypothetical protein